MFLWIQREIWSKMKYSTMSIELSKPLENTEKLTNLPKINIKKAQKHSGICVRPPEKVPPTSDLVCVGRESMVAVQWKQICTIHSSPPTFFVLWFQISEQKRKRHCHTPGHVWAHSGDCGPRPSARCGTQSAEMPPQCTRSGSSRTGKAIWFTPGELSG